MADAAAFFAKKKKGKKKPFKFNANSIDASTVTQAVHVDAPALSSGQDTGGLAGLSIQSDPQGGENDKGSGEQWDDDALAATLTRKAATTIGGTTSELMDMKALDPKRNEQDNIAEKLRVEENKAKLAAAKEGMEREAQRLKDAKDKKKEASSATAPRFAAAAAGGGGGGGMGGKWVPPHMRAGGAGTLPKIRMNSAGGSMMQKVDTQDENLFPDLASAEAIIEQQQKSQQPVFKMVKKTPVGGGATWATKPKAEKKAPKKAEPITKKAEPAPAPAPVSPTPPAKSPEKPKTTTASETSPAAKPASKPLGKKKKKKDLSTFKG